MLGKHNSRFVSYNKRNRQYEIYNKELWVKRNGVWFSKPNVLQDNVIAVYGTLKKGYGNHRLLINQRFVGKGTTTDRYPLIINGLPYLMQEKGKGHNVEVEVYKVDDDTFDSIDALEGHPNFYEREETSITMKSGKKITAWIYFNRSQKNYTNEKYYVRYRRDNNWNYWKPNYQKFTFDRQHQTALPQRDLWSALNTTEDENDDATKYCQLCFEEVKYDETEISNQKYHCSVCNEMYSEQEVTS